MKQLLVSHTQMKRWFAASSLRFCCSGVLSSLLCIFGSDVAFATPYVPSSDDVILVKLPSMNRPDAMAAIAATARTPSSFTDTQRIRQAETLLASAYEEANEDAFGQAEALLAPWAENTASASVPMEAQYMLAVIRQHNHQFTEALALLDAVLKRQAGFGAALLQRAQINLVAGNHEAARQDCISLQTLTSTASAANCIAQVAAVTGSAHETRKQITGLAALQAFFAPAEYTELMLTQAGITHRLGLHEEAEHYYPIVIERDSNNLYAILQYAEFLLEQQRYSEVLQLLSRRPVARLTLELQVKQMEAMQGAGLEEAYAMKYSELEEVFAIARTRAEDFPQKEYARFLLITSERSQEALHAAFANWQYQKEPGELLLLVRAAIAANSNEHLESARKWLASTGLEDHRISTLLDGTSGVAESMRKEP